MRVNDASPLWTTYEFEAKVNATTSNLVGSFADVAYHARVSKLGVGSIGTWILGGVGILVLALIAAVWYTGLCQDAGKQPLLARVATKNRISTTVTITRRFRYRGQL